MRKNPGPYAMQKLMVSVDSVTASGHKSQFSGNHIDSSSPKRYNRCMTSKEKQRGRTSWSSIIFYLFIAGLIFGWFDDDDGNVSIDATVATIEKKIIELDGDKALSSVKELVKEKTKEIQEIKEADTKSTRDNLKAEHISNRLRYKGKTIQEPIPEHLELKKHSDGTIWACEPKGVCLKVIE